MARTHYDFQSCSDEEMLEELLKYSRARFHCAKVRYKDDIPTSERLERTHARVKHIRKEDRRATKYKRRTPAGRLWTGIHHRCSPDWVHRNPAYAGCKISQNFSDLDYFVEWCARQCGFQDTDENGRVFEIDKDLLSTGREKIYSEDVCVFVPREMNLFLNTSRSRRGSLPVGVAPCAWREGFTVMFNKKHHGPFDSVDAAFSCYKTQKEEKAKMLAEKWRGRIDERVYARFMSYEVSIND